MTNLLNRIPFRKRTGRKKRCFFAKKPQRQSLYRRVRAVFGIPDVSFLLELPFKAHLNCPAALRLKFIIALKSHAVLIRHKNNVVTDRGLECHAFTVPHRSNFYSIDPDILVYRHPHKAGEPGGRTQGVVRCIYQGEREADYHRHNL